MKLTIRKNVELIGGETYYDEEIILSTKKPISFSMIWRYVKDKRVPLIYIQIGNFLQKDFKEIELTARDMFFIEEENND